MKCQIGHRLDSQRILGLPIQQIRAMNLTPKLRPLVSLLMSTYSRPDLFPTTFAAMLAQTYDPLEIVVLINGSAEASIDIVAACKDRRVKRLATRPALPMAR